MGLMGTHPTLMSDVPEENAIALASAGNDVRNVVRKYIHAGTLQWTGTVYPNKEWAVKVYPELDEDAALERRFQPVYVEQPSVDDTIEIIRGLKGKYEEHHNLIISDEAIIAATKLSSKYITDRF